LNDRGLIRGEAERGICRVVCFSPRHDLTVATMEVPAIEAVVNLWAEQFQELGARDFINHVQIFENRGVMMGASNPHPHCQIWANAHLPNEPATEQHSQAEYARHGKCLLCDYLALELEAKDRIVFEDDAFVALVPFWAVWPFETMLLGREHRTRMSELPTADRRSLARALRRLARTYDRVFDVQFPYSMGFHQAPSDGQAHSEWHLHAHFLPPLLRSATVRKFMVGYEMLGSPQRDITPEAAAERLREL